MTLHSAWFLLLLAFVPVIWWRYLSQRYRSTVRFSSTAALRSLDRTWKTRMRLVLPVLRTLAVVLLVVALARPRKGNEQTRVFSEGVAIQMLVDRSGSMQAMDFHLDGQRVNRLAAVKKVVQSFVLGDDGLPGRPDDLIGMITFARFADSKCPLTLDHGYLVETLQKTEIVTQRTEDGTAIGDAIALGVEHLRALERQRRLRGAERIKSKIMILLTDGENNAGDITPLKAAELAKTFDIKIYTIGAGTEGIVPMRDINMFGQPVLRRVSAHIDEETLRRIAATTDGKYFRATDTDSLRQVYAEIDKLEKTKTEEKRYLQYKELATESVEAGRIRLPPLLLGVFVLLAVEMVLANMAFRQVP